MLTRRAFFGLFILFAPGIAFAFPAPEAMGAISFALSSIWAHLSAVFGAILGIGSSRSSSSESNRKAFVFILCLLALSISINLIQSFLSTNRLGVLNEVNFQKVQPVPYPVVERNFHEDEEKYSLNTEAYLKDIDSYQLIPVVTQKEYHAEMLQSFSSESPALILNRQGNIIETIGFKNNKQTVLVDWNGDLSRIAINHTLSSSGNSSYLWLKGGYQKLINQLSTDSDSVKLFEVNDLFDTKNTLYVDVSEYHAYEERGYFYSAINVPYSAFFSGEVSLSDLSSHEGPIVFLDFYENKSKAVASWYFRKTGNRAYILDGGYEALTASGKDWVPFYPNQYRLLSPSQIYDWYIASEDVVFLDGRSKDEYERSEEAWLTISTPVQYSDLEDLYKKVDGLDKNKRYAGFVYDQGNAFKMLVLGHALHERGYTWLGLFTRPQVLSYAEIDDFKKNRPHRIEWWQTYVRLTEAYPKAIQSLFAKSELPGWLFMVLYGFIFRLLLIPITLWTSQPLFLQKQLPGSARFTANLLFIGTLVVFAILLQKWIYDFGDLHWSYIPFIGINLTDQSILITALTTGLIGVQLAVTPGLRLFSSLSRVSFGLASVLLIGCFLSGLASGLLLYVFGITAASLLIALSERLIVHLRPPVHSDSLPLLRKNGETLPLVGVSEVYERSHGIKAGRLGDAYRLGFRVPEFFVLNQSIIESLDSPSNQTRLWRAAHRLGEKVIVRSAALTEDATAARIGRLTSEIIALKETNAESFSWLVKSVIDSQSDIPINKRQIVVQRHIDADKYAVAVSRDLSDPDASRIEYGSAHNATEGGSVSVLCLKDGEGEKPFPAVHKGMRRLEHYYGQAIDVECALLREKALILQVRPFHPIYFCQPREAELIAQRAVGVNEKTSLTAVDEAGNNPSPLSLSILKALYGKTLVTQFGRPYLLDTGKKRRLMTFSQFCELLKRVSLEVRQNYETILNLKAADISDHVLIEHLKSTMELLRLTMDLSIQARVSAGIRKKLNLEHRDMIGYWSEDQKSLTDALHHPSVFLSHSDFDIRKDPVSLEKASGKLVKPLPSKLDKSSRVMTDLHYLTARLYTSFSALVHEVDYRSRVRHDAVQGAVFGANLNELLSGQWDSPSLWKSRQDALEMLQSTSFDPQSFDTQKPSIAPFQATIYRLNPNDDLSDIPNDSLIVMEQGRSDIIQVLENAKGILCAKGGENSHWMMVARSLSIFAITNDSAINIDEWAHGCPVTVLTF